MVVFRFNDGHTVVEVNWFEAQAGRDMAAEFANLVKLGEEMHAHNLGKQSEATPSDEPRALTAEEIPCRGFRCRCPHHPRAS